MQAKPGFGGVRSQPMPTTRQMRQPQMNMYSRMPGQTAPQPPQGMLYNQGGYDPSQYYGANPGQRVKDFARLGLGGNANAQMGKDQAAFSAAGQLGVAGQNALGQYGMAQKQALVNSQIAHANSLGQMGNSYYNMMGQLGQYAAGLGAAGAAAASDTNKAGMVAGALGGMGAGAFGGGFNFTGPGGFGGSGSWAGGSTSGGGGAGGGAQFSPMNPGASVSQGLGFLNKLRGDIRNPNSDANMIRGNIHSAFNTTQGNLMDPGIRNDLMGQLRMGYGALGGLYDKSDYGFNTQSPADASRMYRRAIGY